MAYTELEKRDGIGVIWLDQPGEKVNTLALYLVDEFTDLLGELERDDSIRGVVLISRKPDSFIAGADIEMIRQKTSPDEVEDLSRKGQQLLQRLRTFPKPVVAAINGACLAGGLELALACDIRIAADHAEFGLPEVCRGILPGAGGTQRLPRALPYGVAMEMILSGAPIDAAAALRWGLVSHVVPHAGLLDRALEIAGRIAANGPLAVRAARDAVHQGISLPLDQALRLEQFHAEPLRSSDDAREGVQAFIEKRKPEFTGK